MDPPARSGAMLAGSVGRRADRGAGVGERDDPSCHARGRLPIVAVVLADRPCGALAIAEAAGVPAELVERTSFGADFDRVAYTHEVRRRARTATRSTSSRWPASAPSSAKPIHDAFPDRIVNTHPGAAAGVPGLARGRGRARRRREGHRLHGARGAPRGRRRARSWPRRRCRSSPDDTVETLHERIKEVERGIYPARRHRARCSNDEERCMRALLSVYDKTGIVEFARALHELGVSLVSSGGTAHGDRRGRHRRSPTSPTSPAFPAILDHRVVTLHPKVHGGILADRVEADAPTPTWTQLRHRADRPRGRRTSTRSRRDPVDRAHRHRRSRDGAGGGEEPRARRRRRRSRRSTRRCSTSCGADGTRRRRRRAARSARTAFASTAAYDAAIVDVARRDGRCQTTLPPTIAPRAGARRRSLRYGENPHQRGARYRACGTPQLVGRRRAARRPRAQLPQPLRRRRRVAARARPRRPAPAAVASSSTPTRAASRVADDLADAYQRALECDERSAFGGIVALNRPVDAATVERMVAGPQADLVIAPGYEPGDDRRADRQAQEHPPPHAPAPEPRSRSTSARSAAGSSCRTPHHFAATRADWRVVTKRAADRGRVARRRAGVAHLRPREVERHRAGEGRPGRRHRRRAAEPGRVGRDRGQEGRRARRRRRVRSDAFYPFPDGIEAAAAAGVAVIVQPGGSMRDETNIATRRRARPRDGVHRRTALPALTWLPEVY